MYSHYAALMNATGDTGPGHHSSRRTLLQASLAVVLTYMLEGCQQETPPLTPAQKPLPPLRTEKLTDLLPAAALRWLVLVQPRQLASIPWLIPPIAAIAPEENLSRYALSTGVDLRQVPEAAIASFSDRTGDFTFYLARHTGDPKTIEQRFQRRLTSKQRRSVDRPDVIRMSGNIGTTPHTLLLLGHHIMGVQEGGSASRGPARIASLYAMGKLTRTPTILAAEPLLSLSTRFGTAPLQAFAPGPFEGQLARGARGLLAAALAIGAAVRPSVREGLFLTIALAGDFSTSGQLASETLLAAWNDLAHHRLGHLLGLDSPIEPPLATHAHQAVAVTVELDPKLLAHGLAAATSSDIQDIMK